jgi:hypothetical protein
LSSFGTDEPVTPDAASNERAEGASASRFAHDAFISYSRRDTAFAAMMEATLERFRPPPGLPARDRLKVVRDVNDFTAGDYENVLVANLKTSAALIVICTPSARNSRFVDEEIRNFVRLHGSAAHVVPVLLSGIPNNEASPDERGEMAFPEALYEAMQMPLAVDYRGFVASADRVTEEGSNQCGTCYSPIFSAFPGAKLSSATENGKSACATVGFQSCRLRLSCSLASQSGRTCRDEKPWRRRRSP